MKSRYLLALAAIITLSWNCMAQGRENDSCPRKEAQNVADRVDFYGKQKCQGVQFTFHEVGFEMPGGECPLLVVQTPKHQIEVPSQARTMVSPQGSVPVITYRYRCSTTWLLFVLISSNCEFASQSNSASVMQLTTIPCP